VPDPVSGFHLLTRSAKKIVVVDLGFLGDSIHTVPALHVLKRSHPDSDLHVVTSVLGADVLGLAPCVDRVWPVELHPQRRRLKDQFDIIRMLRQERFDLAVNFSGADRTVVWTAATGAEHRLAHEAGRHHFWNRWFIDTWVPKQSRELPVYEQRRQVLAAAGYRLGPVEFGLEVPEDAATWAENRVMKGSVHLSINASSPFKEWPLPRWAELCRLLLKDPELHLVATCGPAERERERLVHLAEAVGNDRLVALNKDLTIARLAAVIGRCAVHVGADSGVTHLAYALGIPTVSVFRDYAGLKEWAPRGRNHWHLTANCECEFKVQPACTMAGEARCLATIPPEAVANLVSNCLG
jgi:heptosyltransferase-1